MQPTIRRALALAALALLAADLAESQRPRARARARVSRPDPRADLVERSLLPAARVAGRDYVAATIPQRLRELGVPAVSVAVIDSGRIAWARAYGLRDVESGDSATVTTLFQAASMSKPVASVAALQLVREGKVSLDAPANGYLASWQIPDNPFTASRPVTLRHLLTHTGGLTVHGFLGYARGLALPTTLQVLDAEPPANSRMVRVDTVPGARWRYSGGGITVMQQLVEDVVGQPFATLMRARVLDPAGMRASTFEQPLPEARERDAATGYRADGSPVTGRFHAYPEMAAAGLWTTPSDLARWIIEVQKALRGERSALLDARTAHEMMTRGLGNWGLGVAVGGSRDSMVFLHGGANEGFRGRFLGYVTRGRGVVVMTNSDAGMRLADEIVLAVAAAHDFVGLSPRLITPAALGEEVIQSFAGAYRNRGGLTVQVTLDATRMWLVRPDGRRWELVATAADRLESPDGPTIQVERDAEGRPRALLFGGDRFDRAG
jgi:CubicO group peptidase (beta-lactamase class C family)